MSYNGPDDAVLMCAGDEGDGEWVHTLHTGEPKPETDSTDKCPVCGEIHPDRLCEA